MIGVLYITYDWCTLHNLWLVYSTKLMIDVLYITYDWCTLHVTMNTHGHFQSVTNKQ